MALRHTSVCKISLSITSKDKQLCCPLQNPHIPRREAPLLLTAEGRHQSFGSAPWTHTHRSHRPPMVHTGHPQTSSLDKKDRRGVSDRETKGSGGFQTPMQVPWVYLTMMELGYSEAIITDP